MYGYEGKRFTTSLLMSLYRALQMTSNPEWAFLPFTTQGIQRQEPRG